MRAMLFHMLLSFENFFDNLDTAFWDTMGRVYIVAMIWFVTMREEIVAIVFRISILVGKKA
jgi:hypothetical protein